jgi:hypothetical protein
MSSFDESREERRGPSFPKLTRTNWLSWVPEMQSRLKGKGCYKYVFRLDEKPKDAVIKGEPTEAEIKLLSPWRDGDEKAFSLIRDCCEPDTLATVSNDITSAELWAKLKSICGNPGAAHYAIIKMDLTHRKCADDGNVREHVA